MHSDFFGRLTLTKLSSYPSSASSDGTLGGADPDIHLTGPVDACSHILAVLGVLVSILCLGIFYFFHSSTKFEFLRINLKFGVRTNI